jgi:hypothetical protein
MAISTIPWVFAPTCSQRAADKDDTKSIMIMSPPLGKLFSVRDRHQAVMKNLVGRSFSIANGHYRIVDVQRLGGDALVYAEQVECRSGAPLGDSATRGSRRRTAFHYGDIAALLEGGPRA